MTSLLKTSKTKLRQLQIQGYQAEMGLLRLSENIQYSILREYFVAKALERFKFRIELTNFFLKSDIAIEISDSDSVMFEMQWLQFPILHEIQNKETLMAAVKESDKRTIRDYQILIDELEFYPELRKLLQKHVIKIQSSYNSYNSSIYLNRIRQASA
ncbi:hypothetical protein [Hanstruepera ponticola]|uniref:hypothetical protein n=1 Tax=Hanstruepera ponticola TaxID=2042995 RepID=UPI000CF0CAFA|nr:hypothetical protein [Hanstruepera ponticola]